MTLTREGKEGDRRERWKKIAGSRFNKWVQVGLSNEGKEILAGGR